MDHVTDDDQEKCILQRCSREHEHISNTDHHSRNGVGNECRTLYHLLYRTPQAAACRNQGTSVSQNCSENCGQKRYKQGVFIYCCQCIIPKHILKMPQSKDSPVRPFLNKRHNKNYRKDGEYTEQNYSRTNDAQYVPHLIFCKFDGGNLVVTDIVPFQKFQQQDADNRRNEHNHCHNRSIIEVWDTPKHLIVKNRGNNLVLPSYRLRNSVIRKAEKKALYKRGGESAEQRPDNCLQKGF